MASVETGLDGNEKDRYAERLNNWWCCVLSERRVLQNHGCLSANEVQSEL